MRLGFDKFSVFTAAALLVAGIFAFSGTSFAADPAYCAQYARLALHEFKPTWRRLVVSRVSTIVGTLITKGTTTGA